MSGKPWGTRRDVCRKAETCLCSFIRWCTGEITVRGRKHVSYTFTVLYTPMSHGVCSHPPPSPLTSRSTFSQDGDMAIMGSIGIRGSGAVVGREAELSFPRALAAAPWSELSILVADWGNSRVVEIDTSMAVLVKVCRAVVYRDPFARL